MAAPLSALLLHQPHLSCTTNSSTIPSSPPHLCWQLCKPCNITRTQQCQVSLDSYTPSGPWMHDVQPPSTTGACMAIEIHQHPPTSKGSSARRATSHGRNNDNSSACRPPFFESFGPPARLRPWAALATCCLAAWALKLLLLLLLTAAAGGDDDDGGVCCHCAAGAAAVCRYRWIAPAHASCPQAP